MQRNDWSIIKMLYLHNNSCAEIASIVGSHKDVICRGLKRYGVEMRSGSDAIALAQSINTSIKPRALRARARSKVERRLGRQLESWEDVHHKDQNLLNLSEDNLQVLDHDKHAKLHNPGREGCEVTDCENKHYANGLCNLHWGRKRKGIPLDATINYRPTKLCSVVGCIGKHAAKGLCKLHWQREYRANA